MRRPVRQTRFQLFRVKGFGQVVIAAGLESGNDIFLSPPWK